MMQVAHRFRRPNSGFTIVELLVVISIIGILASMVLFALAGTQEAARRDRTRAQIARIDALIAEKMESYETRRISAKVNRATVDAPSNGPEYSRSDPDPRRRRLYRIAATISRVDGMRELMRIELPNSKEDILDPPVTLRTPPFLQRAYQNKAAKLLAKKKGAPLAGLPEIDRRWSIVNQEAECLYLILSQMVDEEASALRYFSDTEIGDLDDDGMPEILDAWESPIMFLRWAPGFASVGGYQDREAADTLDPAGVYQEQGTFALYPLIWSPGPNKLTEIALRFRESNAAYSKLTPPNNPFYGMNSTEPMMGSWVDVNQNDQNDSIDDIHNHLLISGN